jgi:aspartate carbamoyltransferase catalytic subunit
MARDLTTLSAFGADRIRAVLRSSAAMAARPRERWGGGELDGTTTALVFLEDSTRTRISFEIAARRLGGRTVALWGKGSSLSKGETLADTVRTVESMGIDAIVLRCAENDGPEEAAEALECPVINAGAGTRSHPTQGLLDAYVIAESHGRLDTFDLTGLTAAIVGDINHSRVARSDIVALTALGARVVCVGPEPMCDPSIERLGCEVSRDLDEAIARADAVQMLRVQFERHENNHLIGSLDDYRRGYAMTAERAERLRDGAVVMHPGPANRGLELESDVMDGPRSKIRRQVACGVVVRMAVLAACLAG